MTDGPSVSVLMPCLNAARYIDEAIISVLDQPECLDLLIVDGGSDDGSLSIAKRWAIRDRRVHLIEGPDKGPADALNKAFKLARGRLVGWLNADDLYREGSLRRATEALSQRPELLMVYGEGEEFYSANGSRRRYPTLPPQTGLEGFKNHCFICQPTVVFRRSMAIMLGPFDITYQTAFDFDYWLRAFAAFPERIGYIPHQQAITRIHQQTITHSQRSRIALEATALIARHFGSAPTTRLRNYALELQLGLATPPSDQPVKNHLDSVFKQAKDLLDPSAYVRLRREWLLDAETAPEMIAAEAAAATTGWHRSLPGQLLQAYRPQLRIEAPGAPAGPHRRLADAIESNTSVFPLLKLLTSVTTPVELQVRTFQHRPFGVNLIGHAFDVFGIGEDIRMAARALMAADVPCCVIDHPAGNGAARSDRYLEGLLHSDPEGGPYAFNLICMAAPIHARWLLEQGFSALRERYSLVSWPWETEEWPQAWRPLLNVADEIWPSSSLTTRALLPYSSKDRPVHKMSMAVEIADLEEIISPQTRMETRSIHGLGINDVIFAYGFDFSSTAARKNPMGVLEAFQQAFPQDTVDPIVHRVGLMIKTFPPRRHKAEYDWLRARVAEDPRIHLVARHLSREDLLRLYGCCDGFISLHRSEGFGRGLAEALQLGLHVIATNFGGNTDFCTGPLAHPVQFKRVPIPRGAYPCADGHDWAEPDLNHAVSLMKKVANELLVQSDTSPRATLALSSRYKKEFSAQTVGKRYRERLQQLWTDRQQIATSLRWRRDRSPLVY
ncbi:MAG: glycosyltransferase [Cyanobium sp.]|jgi:glycosyltransferase involved in cell wall biosynthesis